MSDESSSPAVPDTPTDDDKLGFDRFAVPLARSIAAIDRAATPWTIGVYGEWGSGKTSFLMMVDKALQAEGVHPIWFNAWKYVREDNLWAALIHTVLDEAKRSRGPWVRLRIWAKSVDWWTGTWELVRKLSVLAFRIAMLAVLVLMAISLIPVGVNPVNDAVAKSLTGSSFIGIYNFPGSRIVIGIAALLCVKPDALFKLFDIKLGADFTKFRRKRAHRDETALLDDFNTEFRGLLEVAYQKKPLVVIIDDLDRCLPEQTLQIIETIKLFLDEAGCVFLLAVDREIIEHAIAVKYKDLPELESRRQLGETYFEKVVQLPYSLPPAAESMIEEFVQSLSPDPDVHSCVRILRGSPPYNPRRIKRNVQSFALLKDFASREFTDSRPVPAVLAKLVIVQAQFRQVYRAAVDDNTLLGRLEEALRSPGSVSDLVFAEKVKLFTERYPGLEALLTEGTSEDTLVGVSLTQYLSFVETVAVVEETPAAVSHPSTALVSFVPEDTMWGEWLVGQLTGHGVAVSTTDPENPMQDHEKSSFAQVFSIVSAASTRLDAVRQHWASAIASGTEFLPVQVERCDVPDLLEGRRILDLTGLDEDGARAAFASSLTARTSVHSDVSIAFPGRGAVINNVPLAGVNGIRRDDLLGKVAACFRNPAFAGVPTVCTLAGMGGVGKTFLARQYARENAAKYDLVWWVRADRVREDMAGLAKALEVAEDRLHQTLAAHPRWLLVFDGALNPAELVDFVPKAGTGDVLITSRDRSWAGYGALTGVGPMTREESVELLNPGSGDEATLKRLADALGDLPLALQNAAAYMKNSGTDPADYLALYNENRQSLLGELQPDLSVNDPLAEYVLRVLALLGPDLSWREAVCALVTDDRLVYDRALGELNRLSFVELSSGRIRLHQSVRQAVLDSLDDDTARQMRRTTLTRAADYLQSMLGTGVERRDAEAALTQVYALVRRAETEEPQLSADVLGRCAQMRHALGDWTQARAVAQQALDLFDACSPAQQVIVTVDQVRMRLTPIPSLPHIEMVTIGGARQGKSALAWAVCEHLDAWPPSRTDAGMRFECQTDRRHYGYVECSDGAALAELVTSGRTLPDCALLVIAATDGPRAETWELLQLVREVGVPRVVVAVTKCDQLTDEQADAAEVQVRTFLTQLEGPDVRVVRVSPNRQGEVEGLVRLVEDFVPTPELLINGPFRLPITGLPQGNDGKFHPSGRVELGRAEVGDKVEIAGQPGKWSTIISLFRDERSSGEVLVGDDVTLVLSDAMLDARIGQALAQVGTAKSHTRFKAVVHVPVDQDAPTGPAYTYTFWGMDVVGTTVVQRDELPPGVVRILVDLDTPVAVEPGDRVQMEGGFAGIVTSVGG